MAEVIVGKNESLDNALKRFKRLVQKEGILSEIKKRDHYEKPSEKRKKRVRAAIIRQQKNSGRRRDEKDCYQSYSHFIDSVLIL